MARRLEAEGMARLSFDQEAWRRGIRTMPLPPELHAEIEGELRTRLLDLVQHGADVVLDFSFWSRRARMEYRELLQPYGVVPEIIYLATPRAVALDRMRARGLTHPDDYALPEEVAAAYFDHFETPTADEGPLTVVGAAPRRGTYIRGWWHPAGDVADPLANLDGLSCDVVFSDDRRPRGRT